MTPDAKEPFLGKASGKTDAFPPRWVAPVVNLPLCPIHGLYAIATMDKGFDGICRGYRQRISELRELGFKIEWNGRRRDSAFTLVNP